MIEYPIEVDTIPLSWDDIVSSNVLVPYFKVNTRALSNLDTALPTLLYGKTRRPLYAVYSTKFNARDAENLG